MKAIVFSLEDKDASEIDHEVFMRKMIAKFGPGVFSANWRVISFQIIQGIAQPRLLGETCQGRWHTNNEIQRALRGNVRTISS